jgi:glutamine amidotransferase
MGNLRSVEKALARLGHPATITADPEEIVRARRVVLPGVGAFGAAMAHLCAPDGADRTLGAAVVRAARAGTPVLGICLGMQLLLSESEELGRHSGLNLVPGRVIRLDAAAATGLKVPHMGWNTLRFPRPTALLAGLDPGASVYFVHSYHCVPEDPGVTAATTHHGVELCAALSTGNLHAVQFHPEKSGAVGLRILDNFARL